MEIEKNSVTIPKSESWKIFDEISPRYDLLNHLLSFGIHKHWRSRLAKFLPKKPGLKVLDLATGTADVLISLFRYAPNIFSACGIDLSDNMMAIGRRKITRLGLNAHISLQHGDAQQVPFNDQSFDAVTVAFGIRNMENPKQAIKEMYRVLAENGRAIVLEFSLPSDPLIRCVHLFYLRHMVPLVGALLTGHGRAYRYLNQTIEGFPYGDDFCALLREAGFQKVKADPLLFGVATIYTGERP